MAMTGLAGASWHHGLTIVATGASGNGGEVRKQCYTVPAITLTCTISLPAGTIFLT